MYSEQIKRTIRECMYQLDMLECLLYDANASYADKNSISMIKDLLTVIRNHNEIKGE